jgi:Yip1 domain.
MNLIAGVVLAALGLVIAILSILNVVPGLTGTGVGMILFGGVVIGMSFINRAPVENTEMSTPSTLLNIFVSPSETFQALRQNPKWLVAILVMTLLSVTYSNLFLERLTVERVANYSIDKTLELPMMNDDARKGIEAGRAQTIADAKSPVKRAAGVFSTFAGSVVVFALMGLLFFLVVTAFGGSIYYWQAFSVAVYAAFPVAVIRFILNTIVLYLKDPSEIHPILGQSSLIQDNLSFLVSSSENPVIYTVLASLSLLSFYWIWMNATGLKNGGDRVSSSTGWSGALIAFGIVFFFGVTLALLFPSFIS